MKKSKGMKKAKQWNCNLQCGSNCCDFLYLWIPPGMHKIVEKSRCMIVGTKQFDLKWLKLRKEIEITRLDDKVVRITIKERVPFKIIEHPLTKHHYLHVPSSKCTKLLPNNKCGIYRTRPELCRKSICIAYTKDSRFHWFGEIIRKRTENGKDTKIEPKR